MDSLLDPVIDSSHMSYFAAVEHRALEVLRPRPPVEQISIHHDWVDRYVMKYYCLSLMYSSVFLCFDNFVYCRLCEAGLLTLSRLVEVGPIQLDRIGPTRAPAGLSSHCSTNASMWLTTAVLVYDIAVEAYCPWRVRRQFGQRQESVSCQDHR